MFLWIYFTCYSVVLTVNQHLGIPAPMHSTLLPILSMNLLYFLPKRIKEPGVGLSAVSKSGTTEKKMGENMVKMLWDPFRVKKPRIRKHAPSNNNISSNFPLLCLAVIKFYSFLLNMNGF